MKVNSTVSKVLTNKWVLNIVSFIALLNVIGYMVMGNFNNVVFFIVLAVLVRYFSKNMIIVLGIPLILVNLINLNNTSYSEGMENNDKTSTNNQEQSQKDVLNKALDDKNKKNSPIIVPTETHNDGGVVSSNVHDEKSGFEVGRPKNGGSKIDYATTIEDAYDQLNQILGSDGIKSLTGDTQKLMQQQMELAKSMEAMTPLIKGIMPMAEKAQEMMKSMDNGSGGLGSVMEIAKKMSSGLGGAGLGAKTA
jgi:hypothetical protein